MTVITFDDNLITGNKTIDEQHKELIDRIQQFVSACESEDARVKAIKMLDYLDEYTEFHFKEETKSPQTALFHISAFAKSVPVRNNARLARIYPSAVCRNVRNALLRQFLVKHIFILHNIPMP